MNIPRRRQPQPTRKLRSEIADDVSKQITGDNDIKLARVAHNLHRQRINEEMPPVNVRIFLADFLEHTLPQSMRERHGIGLVAHAHALQAVPFCILERIADDALNPFAGVDVFLDRNLVRSALLESSANTDV